MTAEFELTRDDLAAFARFHYRHSPYVQRQFLGGWLIPAGLWLAAFLVIWRHHATYDECTPVQAFLDLLPLACFVPVWLLGFPWFYRHQLRRGAERMMGEGANHAQLARQRVTITPEEIVAASELGRSSTSWRAVERVAATADHVFVYTSALGAVVVPRRAFAGTGEFEDFVRTAQERQATAKTSV